MQYTTQAPLLWFAREVAAARGWSALEVLDSLPEGDDPFGWARDRARRALDRVEADEVVVIGKSLASAAAGLVADRVLPAVWLTPAARPRARRRRPVARRAAGAAHRRLGRRGLGARTRSPTAACSRSSSSTASTTASSAPATRGASLDALRAVATRIDRFLGDLG